jgi:hypothetical protein
VVPPLTGMEGSVEEWKQDGGYPLHPDEIIVCPLEGDDLNGYYSLVRVASDQDIDLGAWEAEVAAQEGWLKGDKLSKKRKSHSKAGVQVLKGSTITSRVSSQEQFVGFAVLHLGKQPTMALAMEPLVAAKFMGFLLAREGALSSLMKHCTHLSETVRFLVSGECPGQQQQQWEQAEVDKVLEWYANLRGQCHRRNLANPTPSTITITLHQAWQYASTKWVEFIVEFQTNNLEWTIQLANQCMDSGLRFLMVGRKAPPKRLGALRVTMAKGGKEHPCVACR